jgi:hypothetical protein
MRKVAPWSQQLAAAASNEKKRGERSGRNGNATESVAKTPRPLRSWRFPCLPGLKASPNIAPMR